MQILTLIDFTHTAEIAVDQSIKLAKLKNGSVKLAHVSPLGLTDEEKDKLNVGFGEWCEKVTQAGLQCEVVIGAGDFFGEAANLVGRHKPELVVVGNHGKKGLKQNLFGSNIMKLVQKLPVSSLVVNDHTEVVPRGYKKVMVPIAPHHNFVKKIEITSTLLDPEDGKLVLFTVMKPGVPIDPKLQKNIDEASKYLNEQGVNWEYLEVDSTHFSVGYSREIIDIAQKGDYDLISIMAEVSQENKSFGTMDKENIILNPAGIAVLCVSQ